MSVTLGWDDVYEIAQRLAERNPGVAPGEIRLTDVHRLVRDIPEFDDPRDGTEDGVLERIRIAWTEEAESS